MPIKKPKVFIIIVNYNGRRVLNRCLHSLFTQRYGNVEVVVVDNASTDGSLETARSKFSKAHFIAGKKNRGFGGGNNLGISFALSQGAEYVFLLNSDAWIEADTLDVLVKTQQKNNDVLLLSPLILKESSRTSSFLCSSRRSGAPKASVHNMYAAEERTLQRRNAQNEEVLPWFCGGKIDWWRMRATHTPCNPNAARQDRLYETEYISGCAMFVHRSFFAKVGLFDERFFLYYEDADLSLRARAANFAPTVTTGASIFHSEESASRGPQKTYHLVLSGILFFRKYDSAPWRLWHLLYLFLRKCKNRLDRIKDPKNELAQHVSKAYRQAGYFRSHRVVPKRR